MRRLFWYVLLFSGFVAVTVLRVRADDADSIWLLSGSIMKLRVAGSNWQFDYQAPRPGMQDENVGPGTTAFYGTWNGSVLRGTAFVFSRRCGRLGYQVSGSMASDGKSLDLVGYAPYTDPNHSCLVSGDMLSQTISSLGKRSINQRQ